MPGFRRFGKPGSRKYRSRDFVEVLGILIAALGQVLVTAHHEISLVTDFQSTMSTSFIRGYTFLWLSQSSPARLAETAHQAVFYKKRITLSTNRALDYEYLLPDFLKPSMKKRSAAGKRRAFRG